MIILLTIPLSACVTVASSLLSAGGSVASGYFGWLESEKGEAVIVTPPIVDYAPEIQARAADEFERLGPPCARDAVIADCSASARMIMDYGTLREKIRAAKKE